jgi:hypothetical protein
MKHGHKLTVAFLLIVGIASVLFFSKNSSGSPSEEKVIVRLTPASSYRYDTMKPGVIQHIDREYTYDYIPEVLENGLLFQGIHRLPKGTSVKIELLQAATIYFFFHHQWDGGYSEIFPNMKEWKKCNDAPQYDIHNGDHGLHMHMYKLKAKKGSILVPATIRENACFNMVFIFS